MTSLRSRRSRGMRILVAAAGLLFLGGVGAVAGVYLAFLRDLPDLKNAADYRPPLASRVVDRQGRLIGLFFVERRRLTPLSDVPPHVIQAFLSAEDSTFFEHQGIDYMSILRAALVNLQAGGETRQGGSTITQQVVKGLLLSPDRTYRRKIREMILARRIERHFTKQEILYLYLNQIYFGHGAYGIGEAAHTYFGKDVASLSISEAAQLAGLPKAPSHYSPFANPIGAERRRLYVLARMLEDQHLDAASYAQAVQDRPVLSEDPDREAFEAAAYFSEEVRRYLFDTLGGERVLQGGLRIETTLDLELQKAAVAAVRRGLEDLDRRQGFRGVLRRVPVAEIPAELERLAVENGLAPVPPDEPAGEAGEAELELPEVSAGGDASQLPSPDEAPSVEETLAALRALLPEDTPLLGVITAVEPKNAVARVGFAPEISALVRLEDVAWAREANPDAAPRPVEKIERIFRVGDVASFRVLPAPREPLPEDAPAYGMLLATLHQDPVVQGALLSFEVPSGAVLAMVGGYDFAASQFNRVTQARRQPGSAFKPLIYGTALSLEDAEGHPMYTAASIVYDRPKVYVDDASGFVWRPENYGRKFHGPITLRKALAKSVNNAAVHLCDQVGVGRVIAYAQRLGIRSPLERSLALALGSSEVTLLELTRAYAVFPSGGRRVVPRFIERVIDRDGNVLIENVSLGESQESELAADGAAAAADSGAPSESELGVADGEAAPVTAEAEEQAQDPDQLIPPEDAYLMTDLLRAVVLEGTGWRLRKLGRPLAGKTGTTNDQADAWFVGFSPEVTTGVWVGHDESRFLGWGETGSRAAAPIWVDYMREALAGRPRRDFDTPDSIVFTRIDRETGLLASSSTQETLFQAFIAGTEPTETAERQRNTSEALRDLREDSLSSDGAARLLQLDSF
ncbi:MAG: PBP1A family penicillin-binding protein [Myxococcales bacterium]|nr:PBP1A family penicillin-binding protein [Myxococcales bacterium]MDH5566347.1 PBP1A family penicillin-binding protein [Myxococcales bacterium]